MTYIYEYIRHFGDLFFEMAPWLVLGFLIAGLMHLYIPARKMRKMLGSNGFSASIKAAIFGIPLPLCSCGVIPTGIGLHKNGASKSASTSFLISTPQTGVDSILVTYSMLGLPLAVIRPIAAFVTGIFGGWTVSRVEADEDHFDEEAAEEETRPPRTLSELIRYAFIEFYGDIAKWLVVGLAVAAAIAMAVPDNFFSENLGNSSLQMFIMLLASIPMYVCATASVPVAAVLLAKGISPGAALVFLMAGPATNAATMTVIGKALGRRTLFAYLFSIISGALIFGYLINTFLPAEWFSGSMMHLHDHGLLPRWLHTVSGLALIVATVKVFYDRWKKFFKQKKANKPSIPGVENMAKNIITVNGMTCQHCKMNVENNLKKLDFIRSAEADPDLNRVILEGEDIDLEKVRQTIEGIGYNYIGSTS